MKIREGPDWTENILESEKFSLAHFISNFGQYLVELCVWMARSQVKLEF